MLEQAEQKTCCKQKSEARKNKENVPARMGKIRGQAQSGESRVAGAPRGLQNRCARLGALRVGSIPTISVWQLPFVLKGIAETMQTRQAAMKNTGVPIRDFRHRLIDSGIMLFNLEGVG